MKLTIVRGTWFRDLYKSSTNPKKRERMEEVQQHAQKTFSYTPGSRFIEPLSGVHEFLVGRSHDCRLVLDSASVSGTHCEFKKKGSTWSVRDIGSMNGTSILRGSQTIKVDKDFHELQDGDGIVLGGSAILEISL